MRKTLLLAAVAALVLAGCAGPPQPGPSAPSDPSAPPDPPAAQEPLMVVGHQSVLEFGPVLLAAENVPPETVITASGGVPNLWDAPDPELADEVSGRSASDAPPVSPGIADLAGNAGTQTLRMSLTHPDARIVMTVTEGLYRVVARRSSGITSLADLEGKRIATFANTSAAVYLHEVLKTVGLSEADVTISSLTAPASADALINGAADALVIWEPQAERAAQALGDDVVTFQPESGYREIYSLNAKAGDLADPVKRAQIVAFLREVTAGCRAAEEDPAEMQAMLAERTEQDQALIADSWHHHRFPCALPTDLLDVLVAEEQFLAANDGREPRGREELANLIDAGVLEEVLER